MRRWAPQGFVRRRLVPRRVARPRSRELTSAKEDVANNFAFGHCTMGNSVVGLVLYSHKETADRSIGFQSFLAHIACGRTSFNLSRLLASLRFDGALDVDVTEIHRTGLAP